MNVVAVWHGGLLYKLSRMAICGKYIGLIDSFLSEKFQRVLLDGRISKWSQVNTGAPQGSNLGSLLFLAYTNDLPERLTLTAKLFVDNTSIFSVVRDSSLYHHLLMRIYSKDHDERTSGRC